MSILTSNLSPHSDVFFTNEFGGPNRFIAQTVTPPSVPWLVTSVTVRLAKDLPVMPQGVDIFITGTISGAPDLNNILATAFISQSTIHTSFENINATLSQSVVMQVGQTYATVLSSFLSDPTNFELYFVSFNVNGISNGAEWDYDGFGWSLSASGTRDMCYSLIGLFAQIAVIGECDAVSLCSGDVEVILVIHGTVDPWVPPRPPSQEPNFWNPVPPAWVPAVPPEALGGGRYNSHIVAVAHKKIFYGEL